MRSDGRTLVEQTADVLRCAVRTGFYRPGERLPPMRTLCRAAGVSMIVMNEVVARLAAEGLVNPRRGVGCTVLASDETLWKGRVLFVVPESDGSYFTNVLVGVVRETVMKEGWFFQQVTLGSDENGVEKNNALFEFVQTYREKGVRMYGGVLIQEGDNWYFPDGLVDNIDSTEGWKRLELNNL